MASSNEKKNVAAESNPALSLIDPVYEKYVKSVIRALGSSQFYEYFMDSIAHAQNEFQFSNRRMEKIVDTTWVDRIESALPALQNIIASPRRVIREDELIVDVANAKKANNEVVRHLATHSVYVENYEEDTGNVRPSKLMQKYREDSMSKVYENRVVFTTLEMAFQFVKIRHDALFEAMGEEFGAKLKLTSDMSSSIESVHMDMFMHIRDIDDALTTDDKNREIFDRISRLYRILSIEMNSQFAKHMVNQPRTKGQITKTNVLKRNKDYHAVMELLEFLRAYNDVGYTIKVIEQNPVIDETFERDIYHNILFNYLVLKGHLERDKDRRLPAPQKEKKRKLKPKFIKQIIEELTEDYDLPDVEIRKVLIEELTKEQLLKEEEAERRRLVEEQEKKKKEEEEKARLEREAEKERLRQEKEAERERKRREKEAEQARLLVERMEREQEERRRSNLFRRELEHFRARMADRLEERQEQAQQEAEAQQDFADAVLLMDETERLKKEEQLREKQRRRDERERQQREEQLAREQALREEQERAEQLRAQQAAEQERLARLEQERLDQEAREQHERDLEAVSAYTQMLAGWSETLTNRLKLREQQAEHLRREAQLRDQERQRRREAKNTITR